jgi:glutathione S-transferase
MPETMKLHWSPRSPYVRKVMIVAHELGLADRLQTVRTTVGGTTPHLELMRENPLGKIPTLVLHDGTIIYDSPVICEYLDTLAGGGKLFPREGQARWLALRQQALGDGILDAGILARYEQLRPREHQWQEWIGAQMRKVRGALSALEMECESGELAAPADDAPALVGHIAIGCALGWLDFRYPSEVWRERHRRLGIWYDGIAKRRSMQETAPKDA